MESRILNWLFPPASGPSVFQNSRIFGFLSKIFGAPRIRETELSSFRLPLAKGLTVILLFFCIFIPRIPVAGIASFYQLDLRTEDILMAVLILLVFPLLHRPRSEAGETASERAFVWFLIAATVSILNGFFYQTIDKPLVSFLYLLKWIEYFFLFVLVSRLAQSRKEADFFLKAFFLLGISVAGFGYWEHFSPAAKAVYPNYYRLFERAPFHGDANHMGGFLVLWIGFFTGIFLKAKERSKTILLLTALLFVFFPFVWTYSRKSYFALGGMLALPFFFQGVRKRFLWLLSLYVVAALLLPTRFVERLTDLGEVFTSSDPFHSSWAGNWVMWKGAFWNFHRFFVFGAGLGARHRLFYESQYVLILTETGFVGFAAFFILGLSLIRKMAQAFIQTAGTPEAGVSLGWLIGFLGLLIHNFSCVSFTVAKISIPFWFLTAAILARTRRGASISS